MPKLMIEQMESRLLLSAVPPGTRVDLPLQPATGENVALSADQVKQILAQALSQAINKSGQTTEVAVVVDREGEVLGELAGNNPNPPASDTTQILLTLATVRARTAAFFESDGEAFTTRTARFIVQNHFPPGIASTEGGPLYGVEFSDLIGSDVLLPSQIPAVSGDPGGVPLYMTDPTTGKKVAVGGIGVAGDFHDTAATQQLLPLTRLADYDANPKGLVYNGKEEVDRDEALAQAGARGFMAPPAIRASNIFVGGLRLPFAAEPPARGKPTIAFQTLVSDGSATEYTAAGVAVSPNTSAVVAGTPELMNAVIGGVRGLIRDRGNVVMSSTAGVPTPGPGGNPIAHVNPQADYALNTTAPSPVFDDIIGSADGSLTQSDVTTIIGQAVQQAEITRAGIRKPNGINAEVHVVVVDVSGNVLGAFRMNDGTNFSYDVAVQKARTAAFFSDDTHAFSTRAIGFMAQKNFPPGLSSQARGPLFLLQNNLDVGFPAPIPPAATLGSGLTTLVNALTLKPTPPGLENGITIFPGGEPLYKNGKLVGAVGVSGDGVDQDDLISYTGATGFEAPAQIRSDHLSVPDITSFIESKLKQIQTTTPLGYDAAGQAQFSLAHDLQGTRLPYVKFPRNPGVNGH